MKNKTLIITGIVFLVAALSLTGFNIYDNNRVLNTSKKILAQVEIPTLILQKDEKPDYVLNPDMALPEKIVDGNSCVGILEIPFLELELVVFSELSYPNLRTAPCRYHGTPYKDNFVIAAHNYISHFGNLKKLSIGEQIIFTDFDGNKFTYEVVSHEILSPTETELMVFGDWDLTLFTCTIGGASRVTLRCNLIK